MQHEATFRMTKRETVDYAIKGAVASPDGQGRWLLYLVTPAGVGKLHTFEMSPYRYRHVGSLVDYVLNTLGLSRVTVCATDRSTVEVLQCLTASEPRV